MSRTRLGQMNDCKRNATLSASVRSAITSATPASTVLCLDELSLLPLMAAKLLGPDGRVLVCESNRQMRGVLEGWAEANGLADKLIYLNRAPADLKGDDIKDYKVNRWIENLHNK